MQQRSSTNQVQSFLLPSWLLPIFQLRTPTTSLSNQCSSKEILYIPSTTTTLLGCFFTGNSFFTFPYPLLSLYLLLASPVLSLTSCSKSVKKWSQALLSLSVSLFRLPFFTVDRRRRRWKNMRLALLSFFFLVLACSVHVSQREKADNLLFYCEGNFVKLSLSLSPRLPYAKRRYIKSTAFLNYLSFWLFCSAIYLPAAAAPDALLYRVLCALSNIFYSFFNAHTMCVLPCVLI